jgi:hypothetical protein
MYRMNADVYVAARIASSLRDGHASEGTQLLAYALWRLARAISTEDAERAVDEVLGETRVSGTVSGDVPECP